MSQNEVIIPYQPEELPPKSLDIGRLNRLLVEASNELTRYDELLSSLPNPSIISFSLLKEEATKSSRIEGTQATLDEVLLHDAGVKNKAKHDDFQEVFNYRYALEEGHKSLDKEGYKKITLVLIRDLHKILMNGVRGKNKDPGNFRGMQTWIGAPGTDIRNASFVPPDAGYLQGHMGDWVSYLENKQDAPLIQAALMHAQFELLHPFLDGNGRLGRILIPLFLYQENCISSPWFYVSAYLENHRDTYYQQLQSVSTQRNWTGWVRFFLDAVAAQSKTNCNKIRKITALQDEMRGKIQEVTRSRYTLNILNAIFANPYCDTADFVASGIPAPSVYHLVKKLEQHKILTQLDLEFRRKVYAFGHLLDIILK